MSPIRAAELDRYPSDWRQVSASIRFVRAQLRCECDGRCRSRHHAHASRCRAVHREPHPSTGSAVVLTVAHLDHQPENCDPANLMAMCQACHLAYDRDHHADTRRAYRKEQTR